MVCVCNSCMFVWDGVCMYGVLLFAWCLEHADLHRQGVRTRTPYLHPLLLFPVISKPSPPDALSGLSTNFHTQKTRPPNPSHTHIHVAGLLNFMDGFRWHPYDAPQGIVQDTPSQQQQRQLQQQQKASRGGAAAAVESSSSAEDSEDIRDGGNGGSGGGGGSSDSQKREEVAPVQGALRSNELSEAELAGALPAVQQVCVCVCLSICPANSREYTHTHTYMHTHTHTHMHLSKIHTYIHTQEHQRHYTFAHCRG
jgi:hypothetical protein